MRSDILDIVDYLVCAWWRESGGEDFDKKQSPGFTRIVKLLYLLECWYFQQAQERLTDLSWTYYHYGPYPRDLEPILFEAGMLASSAAKDFRPVFRRKEHLRQAIDPQVQSQIDRLVLDWGCRDLYEILDHVYFETAPMRCAQRGELVDIGLSMEDVSRPRRLSVPALSKKRLRELKQSIQDRPKSKGIRVRYLSSNDPDLVQALEGMKKFE